MPAANPKRSIALIGSRGIPARYGGFETFADVIARRLVTAGHRVIVTCEPGGPDAPDTFEGVELRYFPAPKLGPLSTIIHDSLALWKLRRETDVVYLLGYGAALAALAPRLWGTEVWINPDGVEWARAKWPFAARLWFRLMERATMRLAHRVIADAEALADHLRGRHKHKTPIDTIAYGTDIVDGNPDPAAAIERELIPDGYFLIVCRLEPENHVLEAIEGFKAAGDIGMPLAILGNITPPTPYVQKLQAAAEGADVRFLGTEYDGAKLASLRYHARAYVHGHSVGGTNPSLLEALGAGNALIAHDNPFNREVIGPVSSAWFSGASDAARAYKELAELPEAQLQERRAQARERAQSSYSWELIGAAYEKLLRGDSLAKKR